MIKSTESQMSNVREGWWATESVGSDRYAYKVVRVERNKAGDVKAVAMVSMSFKTRGAYDGYPVDGWQAESVVDGGEIVRKVVVRGRYKGRIPGFSFDADSAYPYRDPSF